MSKDLIQTLFSPSEQQWQQLETYVELILKWNKISNLTAIRTADKIWSHHILDSLLVHPHIHEKSLIDVGTGAGLPGIPLAIMDPTRQITLLDSKNKKIQFCQHVILSLKLKNAQAIHSRVEDHHKHYDAVISRAMTQVPLLQSLCAHLVPNGRFYALKSEQAAHEKAQVDIPIQQIDLSDDPTIQSLLGTRYLLRWSIEKK